jgi:hypothetical protein
MSKKSGVVRSLPWIAIGVLAGCATGPAPAPTAVAGPATDELAMTLPGEKAACPTGDEGCCLALDREMRAARARGDDRAADWQGERLALSCPSKRHDLLKSGQGGPDYRQGAEADSAAWTNYVVRLGQGDRITWAAVYFNDRRVGTTVPPGRGKLEAVFHVVSAEGPTAGQALVLRQSKDVVIERGQDLYATIVLRRLSPAAPVQLVLETKVLNQQGSVFGREQDPPRPLGPPPAFPSPAELRDAGAPPALMIACLAKDGTPDKLSIVAYGKSPHLHPRHLGPALDWLRRLTFHPLSVAPDDPAGSCREYQLRFDRVEVPASR